MKPSHPLILSGLLSLGAWTGWSQQMSKGGTDAYRTWRSADATLESDAGTAGATLGARADKVAAEAAKYFAVRKTQLSELQADAEQKTPSVESIVIPAVSGNSPESYLTGQITTLTSNIATVAGDPDRAIQQLRQALERERTAATALSATLKESERAQNAGAQSSVTSEEARGKIVADFPVLAGGLKQAVQQNDLAAKDWADYYRALSDGARGIITGETISRQLPPVGSGTSTAPANAAPLNPLPNDPTLASPARNTITPVPLARYIGAWVYPTVGAHYHGPRPESVDLVVHEENGQVDGTLEARFTVPPGTAVPLLHFQFKGPLQATRNQTFVLQTSGGAAGTVELIPGPAFNLIEVSFTTTDRPETVRQANFLLVKK